MADEIATLISSMGIGGETLLVFCIIAIVVVGAVVVIIATRPILDIYPYLNPSARVRARKGRLFNEKQIGELVDAKDVAEVENYLKGFPDYAEILDEYPLEKALDIQVSQTYDFIAKLAPKEVKDPFVAMAKKVDIDNIKSLLIAKEVGLSVDETKELLIPGGSLYEDLLNLVDAESVNDIVTSLDATEYIVTLGDAVPAYEETGMVFYLEAALDKHYLKKVLSSPDVPADENKEIVYSFTGTKVDIANLKLIIRSKEDGLSYDDVSPFMLTEGYHLREWKLKDLMESPDITNVISGLEGTKYAQALGDAIGVYNETGNVAVFERALDEYLASHAKSLASKKPLGVGPIIGYLSQKETEIKNLKIITRAKREVGFPKSKIVEMLI
ncbi:MAG: ATP synthase A1 subunit C [Methanobrevibacter sp.]|nr:ATP synthase A1 subunit C [Methanobrevibacter sp.]